jgi:hypothetical protein
VRKKAERDTKIERSEEKRGDHDDPSTIPSSDLLIFLFRFSPCPTLDPSNR